MSDLVERARKSTGVEKFIASDGLPGFRAHTKLINELADEIERLREINEGRMLDILSDENVRMRAEIERLRAALQQIADDPGLAAGWYVAQVALGGDRP